jgi:hypothetical protein
LALDVYLRDEEGYDDWFYDLPPDIDWLPSVWGSLLCYSGPFGVVVCGAILGWLAARIDNWLLLRPSVVSYLIGVWISAIPLSIEGGLSSILVGLRGMIPILILGAILTRFVGVARPRPLLRLPDYKPVT